ncbi:unnamed protein product, partial [Prorocentrum cordatum]
ALQRHLAARGQELGQRAPELGLEVRQTLHKCTCLRNEMHHFAQNIYSYVMCEVLETAWARLQSGWQECEDLDQAGAAAATFRGPRGREGATFAPGRGAPAGAAALQVIREHHRYLACIEEGAFLAAKSEPILTALTALFGLALEFAELHEQVCTSAFEAVAVLGAELDGPLPLARALAQCRAQLDQVGASFLMRLLALLRALEVQPPLQHLLSDLRFLLCRLDFNGHYEQKRTAPFAAALLRWAPMYARRSSSPAVAVRVEACSMAAPSMGGVPTPSRAPCAASASPAPAPRGRAATDPEALKERARLEQELEMDRRFFTDPPEDYVRCPTCTVVYAVHQSRPVTPQDIMAVVAPILPASYSKELPRAANLTLEEAMRHMHRSRFRCAQCDTDRLLPLRGVPVPLGLVLRRLAEAPGDRGRGVPRGLLPLVPAALHG